MKRLKCNGCHRVIRIVTVIPDEEHGGTTYIANRKLRESDLFPTVGLCSYTDCELHVRGTHQPLETLES